MATRVALDVGLLNEIGAAIAAASTQQDASLSLDTRKETLLRMFGALEGALDCAGDADHRSNMDVLVSKIADCPPGTKQMVQVGELRSPLPP
jgi:hypothetical protein